MVNRLLLGIAVFAFHLIATIACLGGNSHPNVPSELWGTVLAVLSFPLLNLVRLEQSLGALKFFGIDWLDALVLLNSILWGCCAVFLFSYLQKRRSRD